MILVFYETFINRSELLETLTIFKKLININNFKLLHCFLGSQRPPVTMGIFYFMKTIKLPVMNEINIFDYQRVYSSIVRFSYNRFKEGMDQKEIRQLIKLKEMFNQLDTWFIQSAIYDGKAMFDACSKIGVGNPISILLFQFSNNIRIRYWN